MLRGTLIAMAIISFILVCVFKSIRIGLIALVPNFIPPALSFGLWGYLIGNIGLAASVVTAIAFGTGIDPAVAAAALDLTGMESRVAVLLAQGMSVREVAAGDRAEGEHDPLPREAHVHQARPVAANRTGAVGAVPGRLSGYSILRVAVTNPLRGKCLRSMPPPEVDLAERVFRQGRAAMDRSVLPLRFR